ARPQGRGQSPRCRRRQGVHLERRRNPRRQADRRRDHLRVLAVAGSPRRGFEKLSFRPLKPRADPAVTAPFGGDEPRRATRHATPTAGPTDARRLCRIAASRQEDSMTRYGKLAVFAALAGAAAMIAVAARAGGDKIAFPASYDKGVMYWSFDR